MKKKRLRCIWRRPAFAGLVRKFHRSKKSGGFSANAFEWPGCSIYGGDGSCIAGDTAKAESLAEDLNRWFPKDSFINFIHLPVIRGQVAVDRRDPAKALGLLKPELTYELNGFGQGVVTPFLYPLFVRAGAYVQAAQGKEAAGEYQKIIDNRGEVFRGSIGALAHLGLARAYVLEGDAAKARVAYQDFFSLWNDADPEVPILNAAKSECVKLR